MGTEVPFPDKVELVHSILSLPLRETWHNACNSYLKMQYPQAGWEFRIFFPSSVPCPGLKLTQNQEVGIAGQEEFQEKPSSGSKEKKKCVWGGMVVLQWKVGRLSYILQLSAKEKWYQ